MIDARAVPGKGVGRFRRGGAVAGLIMIVLAVPLVIPFGSLTLVFAFAGGSALTYGLLDSGYPILGAIASFSIAFGVLYGGLSLFLS